MGILVRERHTRAGEGNSGAQGPAAVGREAAVAPSAHVALEALEPLAAQAMRARMRQAASVVKTTAYRASVAMTSGTVISNPPTDIVRPK